MRPTTPSMLPLVLLVVLGACEDRGSVSLVGEPEETDDTAIDSDTGDTSDSCQGAVDTVLPPDGATDVSPGTAIRIDFVEAPVQSQVAVRLRAANSELPGDVTWSEDGLTAFFDPLQSVPSDTEHQLTVSGACGDSITTFTTGAPTWRLGFGATTQVEPQRGPDLGPAFGTVLVRLDAASDRALDLVVAPARGSSQDTCGVTSDGRSSRDDDAEELEISFGLAEIVVGGAPTPVGDLRLFAALDAVTERLGDVTLAARVPVPPIESALGRNSGTLCGPGGDQVPCVPCPGSIGGSCVRVELSDVTAGVSSAEVERVGPGDIPGTCGR